MKMSKGIRIRKQGGPVADPPISSSSGVNCRPAKPKRQPVHDDIWLKQMDDRLADELLIPVRDLAQAMRGDFEKVRDGNDVFATIDLTRGWSRCLWLALLSTPGIVGSWDYEMFTDGLKSADELNLWSNHDSEGENVVLICVDDDDETYVEEYPSVLLDPERWERAALRWLVCEMGRDPERLRGKLERLTRRP